jgi:hypothetical protein
MGQPRPRSPTISRILLFSADLTPRPKDSMLYSFLPSAVQSRLPRLQSLRRSISMYGLATKRKAPDLDSRPSSGTRTPELGYTSAMVLSGSAETRYDEQMDYVVESASSDEDTSRPGTGESRQVSGMELRESTSGIGWKFANQGMQQVCSRQNALADN